MLYFCSVTSLRSGRPTVSIYQCFKSFHFSPFIYGSLRRWFKRTKIQLTDWPQAHNCTVWRCHWDSFYLHERYSRACIWTSSRYLSEKMDLDYCMFALDSLHIHGILCNQLWNNFTSKDGIRGIYGIMRACQYQSSFWLYSPLKSWNRLIYLCCWSLSWCWNE